MRRRRLVLLSLVVACSDPPAHTAPAPAPARPATTAIEAPPAMPSAPWTDPSYLAAGIAQTHFAPALTSGKPYTVTDSATGRVYPIRGSRLIQDASGVPQAYPTSATDGHALASTTTDGIPLVIDFHMHWNSSAQTINGSSGVFEVVSADVHQIGDGAVHATFEKHDEYWTRTPSP